ncbi:hypothetical protein BGZ79_010840, partial [Entomortierella chlamydospora]
MKSFKEFVETDGHSHPNFEKQYACYMAYVGRQKSSNNTGTQSERCDAKLLRQEYKDIRVERTISTSHNATGDIIDASIEQYSL